MARQEIAGDEDRVLRRFDGGRAAAAAAGADRVELCAALFEGGLTPSRGAIRQARRVPGLGLHVMIRPRGGDFRPDDDDVEAMLCDIATAREEGADGVVFGLLTPAGRVDRARMRVLVAAARPLAVTFHRAFDMTDDPAAALEDLVGLGIERVLTSGAESTVLEGVPSLRRLIDQAGERIVVMPGGGVTARNARRIIEALSPREIHFGALVPRASDMAVRHDHVFMGGELRAPEYGRLVTTDASVRAVIDGLR